MSVISLIVILCILGLASGLVNSKMPPTQIKTIINVVIIATAVLLCLSAFGVWDQIKGVQVPKL